MKTATFRYAGRAYHVSPLGKLSWSFTAHDETFTHLADMDLVEEFGNDDVAWGQYIDDVMLSLGLIEYDREIEEYVNVRLAPSTIQVVGYGHPDYYVQH